MKLEELEKITAAATSGPWGAVGLRNLEAYITNDRGQPSTWEDAIFIVAAREAMPKLLAVARAAEKYAGNLGMHHYWRCDHERSGTLPCTCGGQELWDSLAKLEEP